MVERDLSIILRYPNTSYPSLLNTFSHAVFGCDCSRYLQTQGEHRFFLNDQPHVLEGTPYTAA